MILRIFTTCLLASTVSARAENQQATKAAVVDQSATQPKSDAPAPESAPSIGSEVNIHDLLFLAHALDLGKSLTYLAKQTALTNNPSIKAYGNNLVKTLDAQNAVLTTVAEMRKLKAPTESPTQKRISEKLGKLEGAKFQKALLDAFIELDERFIATYELGEKSSDANISKFARQALPEGRKHLLAVQGLAGIAPQYVERTTPAAPAPASTGWECPGPVDMLKARSTNQNSATANPNIGTPPVATKPATKPAAPFTTKAPAKPAVNAPAKPPVEATPIPSATAPPATLPPKPEPKPTVIAEPLEDVAPKKLEAAPAKPARPSFRTNFSPQN